MDWNASRAFRRFWRVVASRSPARTEMSAATRSDAVAPFDGPQRRQSALVANALNGIRVLAADDHPMNRLVLGALLEQSGVALDVVNDGVEALEATRAKPFDVILMDVRMPRLDGPAAARAIRLTPGLNQRTPILALTADTSSERLRACREAGMDGHVPKPIDLAVLLTSLGEAAAGERPLGRAG